MEWDANLAGLDQGLESMATDRVQWRDMLDRLKPYLALIPMDGVWCAGQGSRVFNPIKGITFH